MWDENLSNRQVNWQLFLISESTVSNIINESLEVLLHLETVKWPTDEQFEYTKKSLQPHLPQEFSKIGCNNRWNRNFDSLMHKL
jgi:hypothetical protein